MRSYFENLVANIEASLGSPPGEASARKRLALEIGRLGARLYSGKERVAWCGVLAPFDLLSAMGVTSCFVEFVGAMLASTGSVETFLAGAEQAGYSTDSCSYHRSVTGAALQGVMPVPDFLVATSTPCSGGLAVIENLARIFKKDLFVVHVPHENHPQAVAALAEQYHALADFVAQHTGRPLDPDQLRQSMERTNRVRQLLVEVYHLAQAVPSPARRRDLINLGIVMPLFFGTDGAVEVAQRYRDEFARKVELQIAGVPGERVRLLWLQNRIQFDNPLERLLEEEFRAAVVVDELNDIRWEPIDPADPFTGIARRALSVPLTGPVSRRVENLQRLARDYRVHGAINPCHWGCRQGTGARGLLAAGLKKAGVPVLNLEVDCVDPRNFALGQLRTRLQAFLEMVDAGLAGGAAN